MHDVHGAAELGVYREGPCLQVMQDKIVHDHKEVLSKVNAAIGDGMVMITIILVTMTIKS